MFSVRGGGGRGVASSVMGMVYKFIRSQIDHDFDHFCSYLVYFGLELYMVSRRMFISFVIKMLPAPLPARLWKVLSDRGIGSQWVA